MPENITLRELHKIIQTVMGWDDFHLYTFSIFDEDYGLKHEDFDFIEINDDKRIKIIDLDLAEKEKFEYVYDFGDNWEHVIKVEKILPFDPAATYPKCLAGKRACPPEDCGGFWGYEEILELSKMPKGELDEDQLERLDWLGEYDFEYFSADETNEIL